MRTDVTSAQPYAHVVLNAQKVENVSAQVDGVDSIAKYHNACMDAWAVQLAANFV